MKKNIIIIYFVLFFQLNIVGQTTICDSTNYLKLKSIDCQWFEKLPQTRKDTSVIINEFKHLIDTNLVEKSIYVKLLLDSLGNVNCAEILQGNENSTDSIALKYSMDLKFYPAETKGRKKVESLIAFELYKKNN
ncbi:MAG: hypothetical protein WAR79_05550 [Melioribacteraceae bacterium]